MKTNRAPFVIFFALALVFSNYMSADNKAPDLIYRYGGKKDSIAIGFSFLTEISKNEPDAKKITAGIEKIVNALPDSLEAKNKDGLLPGVILVLVFHPFAPNGKEDSSQVKTVTLKRNVLFDGYQDRKNKKYVFVDSVYDKRKMLFVLLGNQVNTKTFRMKAGKSYFAQNLSDAGNLAISVLSGTHEKLLISSKASDTTRWIA